MNINTFDLNLLRVFDAIMRKGNITAAGARLGLTQPAMSHALKRLRKTCNDPLFSAVSPVQLRQFWHARSHHDPG